MSNVKSLGVAAVAGLALMVGWANADVIYSESFDVAGSSDVAINTFGWSAYRNNGADHSSGPISGSPGNELVVVNAANDLVLVASSSTTASTHFALLSDAGTIDPTLFENDLTISFTENATNESTASPEMGWRVLVQVGTMIYASDFISFTPANATTTRNVVVSSSVWHVWTAETNLSNGFDITAISGTAGALPAGNISGIGILAIDGNGNNDRMRLFDFSITATPIPEPASLALASLGLLLMAPRRRWS